MNDVEKGICFICGKEGADSKDHIPPKNIFLSQKRNIGLDLITVPAHSECNRSFSKDDETFRFFLTIPGYWTDQKARDLWEGKVFKGLSRPEAKKYLEYIGSLMEPIQLLDKQGNVAINTALVKIDPEKINRVIERITRGIFYHETHNILPLDHILKPMFLKPEFHSKRFEIIRTNECKSFGDDTFKYWWNRAIDNPSAFVFWFRFFKSVNFVVFASDKETYAEKVPITHAATDVKGR